MHIIRGLPNLDPWRRRWPRCVLAIGNFDGVHLGHQALLTKLRQQGAHYHLPTLVLLFEPQPLEFFLGSQAPARLMPLAQKIVHLCHAGIDGVLCLPFNQKIAKMSAKRFIIDILVQELGIKSIVAGEDFCFGHDRTGNIALLKDYGTKNDFTVFTAVDFTTDLQIRISSTMVRKALKAGNFKLAESGLGHPYSIYGRVGYGQKLGQKIGFPTANIVLKRLLSPLHGVYLITAQGKQLQQLPGIANIGYRPTLNGKQFQLEAHLFSSQPLALYRQHLDVIILQKLRDEKRFPSLSALIEQITDDVAYAKQWFNQYDSAAAYSGK